MPNSVRGCSTKLAKKEKIKRFIDNQASKKHTQKRIASFHEMFHNAPAFIAPISRCAVRPLPSSLNTTCSGGVKEV